MEGELSHDRMGQGMYHERIGELIQYAEEEGNKVQSKSIARFHAWNEWASWKERATLTCDDDGILRGHWQIEQHSVKIEFQVDQGSLIIVTPSGARILCWGSYTDISQILGMFGMFVYKDPIRLREETASDDR